MRQIITYSPLVKLTAQMVIIPGLAVCAMQLLRRFSDRPLMSLAEGMRFAAFCAVVVLIVYALGIILRAARSTAQK